MKFFLDFDRTIFDTARFQDELLYTHPLLREEIDHLRQFQSQSPERIAFLDRLAERIEAGEIVLDTSAFSQYVFSDARVFIQTYGERVSIITFGNLFFQKLKVEHALTGLSFSGAIYTGFKRKGEILIDECTSRNFQGVFVDDSQKELESVSGACPKMKVIEMRRDDKEPVGAYPVAHTFHDVEALI